MPGEVWVYEREGLPVSTRDFPEHADVLGGLDEVVFRDGARGFVALRRLLALLAKERPAAILVPSVATLGPTPADRRDSLLALAAGGVPVLVADCPHVRAELDPSRNAAALGGLADGAFPETGRVPVARKPGRPAADFPEGWEQLFEVWEAGGITARAFMERTGLRRGTFYHLVADWRDRLARDEARAG